MRKILILFTVFIILFSSTLPRSSSANPVAPAVVLGGMGVGALAGASAAALEGYRGFENAEDTWELTQAIWATADSTVRAGIEGAVNGAIAAGESTVSFGQDVMDWWNQSFKNEAIETIGSRIEALNNQYLNDLGFLEGTTNWNSNLVVYLEAPSDLKFAYTGDGKIVDSAKYIATTYTEDDNKTRLYTCYKYISSMGSCTIVKFSIDGPMPATGLGVLSLFQTYGGSVVGVELPKNIDNWAEEIDRILSTSLTASTPLSLDLADVVATTTTGDQVKWDPIDNTWKDTKGVPLSPDIPVEGVQSIPKTNTGNPPIEGEVTAPPIEGNLDYSGFFRNILQKLADLVSLLSTGLIGDFSQIKYDKLEMSAQTFTTKFPFSLPWDVGRALDSVFGQFDDGDLPSWKFSISWIGHPVEWDITIPEYFVSWFPITRAMILIMFDISLVYAVRKLLGGAS